MPNKQKGIENQKYLGAFRPNAGTIEGKQSVYLGYVQECPKDKCPLFEACDYKKKGKCTYEDQFLKTMWMSWSDPERGIGDIMSQQQLHRVGTTLLSLYSQFIRLQKVYDATKSLEYEDSKGVIRIHPVTKEIRDVQKAISLEIRDAGLYKTWEAKFGKDGQPPPDSRGKVINPTKHGNRTRFEEYEEKLKKKND